jgi:hypothetical protein
MDCAWIASYSVKKISSNVPNVSSSIVKIVDVLDIELILDKLI